MNTIALALFFLLFAIERLLHANIPPWVLGVVAAVVAITLIAGGNWRTNKP